MAIEAPRCTGVRYRRNRFRLDNRGLAPKGVGQVDGFALFARYSLDLSPTADLTFWVGAVLNGEIELEQSSGARISDDLDASAIIAISSRIRF